MIGQRNSLPRRSMIRFAVAMALMAASASTGAVSAQEIGLTAQVDIPPELLLTTEGGGFDNLDVALTSTGGPVVFTTVGAAVTLPIPVVAGRGILEYTDTGSGTTVKPIVGGGHVVRMPIKDDGGSDTIRILLTVDGLVGTGDAITGTVTAINIDLPTRSADLSAADERVGTASVKLLGSLKSFPGASGMTMTIGKEADAEAASAFGTFAATRGLEIDEIAFAAGFAKTGLEDAIDSITLRLSVSRAWVDAVGVENVRVFRRADDGVVEVLNAPIQDPGAADIQFNTESPNGLSTFVIAAVKAAAATPTPEPTATPGPVVVLPTATPVPVVVLPTETPAPITVLPTATPTAGETPLPTPTQVPAPLGGESGGSIGLLTGAAGVLVVIVIVVAVVMLTGSRRRGGG